MTSRSRCLLISSLVGIIGATCLGQQGPDNDPVTVSGFVSEGLYDGGVDKVNLFNGRLILPIPIGPSYPVGPKLRFQANLVYNSRVWEFGHPASQGTNFYTPVAGDPALGIGWTFSLGAVKPCKGTPAAPVYCYYAPDGSQHMFTIADTVRGTGYFKTNDGTRLSLTYDSGTDAFWMWDEDGNKHVFSQHVSGYDDSPGYPPVFTNNFGRGRDGWYVKTITDPFSNAITVNYAPGKNGTIRQTPCWTPAGSMLCPTLSLSWIPASIVLPGATITIGQDSSWRISSFTFPSGGTWNLKYDLNPGTALYHNGSLGDVNLEVLSEIDLPTSLTGNLKYSFVYYHDDSPVCTPAGLMKSATLPTGATIAYTYRPYAYYHTRVAWFPNSCNVHPPSISGLTVYAFDEYTCANQAPDLLPGGNCSDDFELDSFFESNVQGIASRTITGAGAAATTTFWQYAFPYGEYGTSTAPSNCDPLGRCGAESMTIVVHPATDFNGQASGHQVSQSALFQMPDTAADDDFGKAGALIEERWYDTDVHISPATAAGISTPCSATGTNQPFCSSSSKVFRVVRRAFDYGDGTNGGLRRPSAVTTFFTKTNADESCTSCPAHTVAVSNDSGKVWDGTSTTGNGRHYNTVTHSLAGGIGGGTRTLHTGWDPEITTTTYLPDLFTETKDTVGGSSREDFFTFDTSTGFLNLRYLTDGTTSYFHCFYPETSGGAVAGELWDAKTSGTCPGSITSAGNDQHSFALTYTDSRGEPVTATWRNGSADANWKALDYTRDTATGWVLRTRDTAGFETVITRDALGRPVTITPPQPSSGTTDETYFCYDKTKVMFYTADPSANQPNCAVTAGSLGVRVWEQDDFDGLGRLIRISRKRPDGTLAIKTAQYDARSNEIFTSEWTSSDPTFTPATDTACVFSDGNFATKRPATALGTYRMCFDPFGRPQQVVGSNVSSLVTIDRKDGSAWYSDTKEAVLTYCVNAPTTNISACTSGNNNQTVTTVRDGYGRVTSVTDELNVTTTYTYDTNGNVKSAVVGSQATRSFTLDPAGHVLQETTPEKGTVTYDSYGGLGNLRQKTEPGSLKTLRCWDFAGRIISIRSNEDGSASLSCTNGQVYSSYTYDNSLTGNAKSRLTQRVGSNFVLAKGSDVAETFTYRSGDGRLSSRSISVGNGSENLSNVSDSWNYDTLGALSSYGHPRPSGSFTETIVNSLGLPTSISASSQTVVSSASYTKAATLGAWTAGNSVTTTIAQDTNLLPRPLSITTAGATTNLVTGNYAYDGAGNILSIGSNDNFKYDAGSRLISANYSGSTANCTDSAGNTGRNLCIGFDTYGNLTSMSGAITKTLPANPTTNRLTSPASYVDGAGNDRGNLNSFTGETLVYDGLNRLVRDLTGSEWNYFYDGAGERIVKFPGGAPVLRREMSKYIVQALGQSQSTAACTGSPSHSAYFTDVLCADPDRGWIDKFKEDGVTSGCGAGIFCPGSNTRRDQMAVFFVKARGEQPVANASCTTPTRYADVPCNYDSGGAIPNAWGYIERFSLDGITSGCGGGNYCPGTDTTEVQMIAFLQRSWNSYLPVPRGSIYTFRDLDGQIVSEYRNSAGGASAPATYPIATVAARDNVYLGRLLVGSDVVNSLAGATGWTWYHSDHLGSPRVVTNTAVVGTNKQSIEVRKYWPFGDDVSGNPISMQTVRFATMEVDEDGKHYNDHARSFDLGTVRFLTPDPVAVAQGSWNRYAYVLGKPLILVDPRGLDPRADDCSIVKGDCPFLLPFFPNYPTLHPWTSDDGEEGWFHRLKEKLADTVCPLIPDAGTIGATLGADIPALGLGGSVTGEYVTNYNTGEVSAFLAAGPTGGTPALFQGYISEGYIYGLPDGNSGYAGPFITTTASGPNGMGVFHAVSSGGPGGAVPNGNVTANGFTLGISRLGGGSGSESISFYTDPMPVSSVPLNPIDFGKYLLKKTLCGS